MNEANKALQIKSLRQVALIGNPNTGKSTIFNNLTGLRQRMGNYPGVTVAKKSGSLILPGGGSARLMDLPGTYSLLVSSPDERVVLDALNGHMHHIAPPDVVVCVIDATNLKRNLFLASQVAEMEIPMVLVLNQIDAAQRSGIKIDCELLEERFGVPVVATVARRNEGTDQVLTAIDEVLKKPRYMKRIKWRPCVPKALEELRPQVDLERAEFYAEVKDSDLLRVLFDTNPAVRDRMGWSREQGLEIVNKAQKHLLSAGLSPSTAEPVLHYEHLEKMLEGVISESKPHEIGRSESVDRLVLNRVWGLLIFATIMYLIFSSVYSWAQPLMNGIEFGMDWVKGALSPYLSDRPIFHSLVTDGMISGVGAFLVFLPQILILFFFISLLEDTGYMARAAFLMDKMFHWCGLSGKSFVPLLSCYACAVPGIMGARTIEDPKARLVTILIAPFMSCSARLPVYVLLIGAFVMPRYGSFVAAATLFAMHLVGLFIAIPTALILNRSLKVKPYPFLLEMPRYRVPRLRDVLWRMWQSGWEFVKTAGTAIFIFSVLVWALLYFPRTDDLAEKSRGQYIEQQLVEGDVDREALLAELNDPESKASIKLANKINSVYIEQSYLGRFGKWVQPVFEPAGFDWKITVAVLSSFPAREIVVSSLGIIHSMGSEVDESHGGLRGALKAQKHTGGELIGQPVFTLPVAFGLMLFFALCSQCAATLATIAKESSWRWAVFSFFYMTGLAWLAAVASFQIGKLF